MVLKLVYGKYKAIRLFLLLFLLMSGFTGIAQISNDFELGSRSDYIADCWTFIRFDVSTTEALGGTYSAYSLDHNLPSGQYNEVGSPFLKFEGYHMITVKHKKLLAGNILFEVFLVDRDGNESQVFVRNNYPANTLHEESFSLNISGIFRVVVRTTPNGPGNENNHSVVDEITVSDVEDVADRNSRNFSGYDSESLPCACVQSAPVGVDDYVQLDENTSIDIFPLTNDSDADNDLDLSSIVILVDAEHGTTTIDPVSGKITYTAEPNFADSDEITYQVSDEYPFGEAQTATAVIHITVNPVNDAPVSADNTVETDEDVTYAFQAGDILYYDVDGDCLNGFKILSPLTNDIGELLYNGGPVVLNTLYPETEALSFVPAPGVSGTTSFGFSVVDDMGGESPEYTMTIIVKDVNDIPETDDLVITMQENSVYYFTQGEFSYADEENDPLAGYEVVAMPDKGQLYYNGILLSQDETFSELTLLSYEPLPDEEASPYTSFEFVVIDARDGRSDPASVLVNVLGENNPEYGELLISQGFSPNSDNINDYWYIQGIEAYSENKVQIYNRWGDLVRTIRGYSNQDNSWRGESDQATWGENVPDGSYFFILSLGDGSSPIQGYVIKSR